jgi:hypothetical protein
MQQDAWTGSCGIRYYDGLMMVAIGTGWGFGVGDEIEVLLSSGWSFTAVVGDIKADIHTDATRRFTVHNNCWVEFIVDIDKICRTARRNGSMTSFGFPGWVTEIRRLEWEVDY